MSDEKLNPEDSKKLVNALGGLMKKNFEANQERPFQYVVEYRKVSDDSLIGYHQSTFCQVSNQKEGGKRYSGENPYDQLGTIHKNLTHVLESTEDDTSMVGPLKFGVKQRHFEGLDIADIYLEACYLDEDTPKQKFVFKLVE